MGRLREIVFESWSAPAPARFWAAALDGYARARLATRPRSTGRPPSASRPETDPIVLVDGPGSA